MINNLKNNIGETIFAAILFIMGLFMILYSRTFPKPTSLGHTMTGPSFFPTLIGSFLLLSGIIIIIRIIFKKIRKEIYLRKMRKTRLKENSSSIF